MTIRGATRRYTAIAVVVTMAAIVVAQPTWAATEPADVADALRSMPRQLTVTADAAGSYLFSLVRPSSESLIGLNASGGQPLMAALVSGGCMAAQAHGCIVWAQTIVPAWESRVGSVVSVGAGELALADGDWVLHVSGPGSVTITTTGGHGDIEAEARASSLTASMEPLVADRLSGCDVLTVCTRPLETASMTAGRGGSGYAGVVAYAIRNGATVSEASPISVSSCIQRADATARRGCVSADTRQASDPGIASAADLVVRLSSGSEAMIELRLDDQAATAGASEVAYEAAAAGPDQAIIGGYSLWIPSGASS